jgi:TolB-like protein
LSLLLLAIAAPQVAQAKSKVRPNIAVLDFGVLQSGVRSSEILTRMGTDAVVTEITRTRRYNVIPRTQLSQKLHDIGLSQPLNNNGIRKLGLALGLDYVASGDIVDIGYTQKPRHARVTLSVRLTDVASGELFNGAIETGYSSAPSPGMQPDDETLINQAITDAAFNVVKTMNNYMHPEARILLTKSDAVTLNRGSRDGIQPGLEFVVTRGRERIGTIQVTEVEASTSAATILDPGKGIRPEDRAIVVFRLPGYNIDPACDIISSTVPTSVSRPLPTAWPDWPSHRSAHTGAAP